MGNRVGEYRQERDSITSIDDDCAIPTSFSTGVARNLLLDVGGMPYVSQAMAQSRPYSRICRWSETGKLIGNDCFAKELFKSRR